MACETDTAEAILGLNIASDHQSLAYSSLIIVAIHNLFVRWNDRLQSLKYEISPPLPICSAMSPEDAHTMD